VSGTVESAQSVTREPEEPRIVAASTPSRVSVIELLRMGEEDVMDVVIPHGAGLDVHQATVVATVRCPGPTGGRQVITQTFGTMTPDLIALHEWLQG
jgi:hypothetical protein